jgi:LytS/YehU family sensor histidine kinase
MIYVTLGLGQQLNAGRDLNDMNLVIAVMNPYDADMQMPTGTGFGLNSVKRRLYLLFARSDLVEINKEKNYFVVVIKIPDTNE